MHSNERAEPLNDGAGSARQDRTSSDHDSSASLRHEARAGLREVLPIAIVVFPFGVVFGTTAFQAKLSLSETMGFGALLYAGASQLAAVQMVAVGAPLWAVLLSILAVNFRHVLYSASIGRLLTRFSPLQKAAAFFLLVDPTFAAAEARATTHVLSKRFYFTYAVVLYVAWILSCWLGFTFGRLITDPHALGLDFLLPVYFLALVTEFHSRANFFPVVAISATVSALLYVTVGPPWHVTFGGLAGIAYAAVVKPRAPEPSA